MNDFAFSLLGRKIFGKASTGVEAALRRLFGFSEQQNALESDFRLELVQSNTTPPNLDNPFTATIHQGNIEVATHSDVLLVRQADATAQLEFAQNSARLTLFGNSSHLYACLMAASIEALRASGLLPMHTAIAAKDGVGIAFTGESGRGKTTTLLHSIKAGYSPVCEDFAWLEPMSSRVYGTDRGLRCLPDTLARLETFFPGVVPVAFEADKHLVPFEALAPRVWVCELGQVWTLARDLSVPTRLEPLGAAQAAMALYAATGVPLGALTRAQAASAIQGLVKRLVVKQLWIGSTELPF
ncbi:MAG: hypothetical protein ACK41E_01305 [Deinococcales bacterium]